MKIAFVTGSRAKHAIAVEHMAAFGIEVEHVPLDLTEIQSSSVCAIAEHKAAQAFQRLGRACIVEDSAFGIDELGAYPGTSIKQLIASAGPIALTRLADLSTTRACTCAAALVYVDAAGTPRTFTHSRRGTVANQPQGDADKLALWTVYCPPNSAVPLAAMTPADHRQWQQQLATESVFAQCGQWLTLHSHRPPPIAPRTVSGSSRRRVFGLLQIGRDLMLVCRNHNGHDKWCVPGGDVHDGELLIEALHRLIQSQTGRVPIEVGQVIAVADHNDEHDVNRDGEYGSDRAADARPVVTSVYLQVPRWEGLAAPADPSVIRAHAMPIERAIELLDRRTMASHEIMPLLRHLRGATAGEVYGYRDGVRITHG